MHYTVSMYEKPVMFMIVRQTRRRPSPALSARSQACQSDETVHEQENLSGGSLDPACGNLELEV